MRILRRIIFVALAIVVQFYLIGYFTFRATNLAKTPYRLAERSAAFNVFANDPSSKNKAAFEQEVRLATRHTAARQLALTGAVLAVILGFEGLLIYSGKKREDTSKAVA